MSKNINRDEYSRHYWKAELKQWEWVPEENAIKESYIAVEKDFTDAELQICLRDDKLVILGYFFLGLLVGSVGFIGNWVAGLISMGGVGILAVGCALLKYQFDHHKNPYSHYLGEEDGYMCEHRLTLIFAEELAQLQESKIKQEKLAAKWRKKHPLEEHVRLALSGNPNYIADLLRYCELVKAHSDLKEHIAKSSNLSTSTSSKDNPISVMYIDSSSNNNAAKTRRTRTSKK